jgi:hypothetical protein
MIPCRELFKKLNTVLLGSKFLSLTTAVCCGQHRKVSNNSDIHSTNTRHKHDLHMKFSLLGCTAV